MISCIVSRLVIRVYVHNPSTSTYQFESCVAGKRSCSMQDLGLVLSNMRLSLAHFGFFTLALVAICHKALTYIVIYPLFRLLFGTLYPAYASYKAVKTKNVKEYVKWMMYWIVFALFTCAETFTDVFFSWLPFYYEIKIILVIWLLSPATKGSSILYRKFVHPALSSREQEIDEYITKAKEQSYKQFLEIGSKGVTALMQTAIKGGGGIVNQLRKSYSLSDLSDPSLDSKDGHDETDVVITDPRLIRRRRSPSTTTSLYFPEVDVVRTDRIQHVQSVEDISSGYSSGEGLYVGQPPKLQVREGLVRTGSLTRARPTRVTRSTSGLKKSSVSEESDDSEVFDSNIIFVNDRAGTTDELSSEEEFLDSVDSLHEESGNSSTRIESLTACVKRKSLEKDKEVNQEKEQLVKNTEIKMSENTSEIKREIDENKKVANLSKDKSETEETDSLVETSRGGKYHKKMAPKPPMVLENVQPIKATLVLKSGIVKPLELPNSECKEVFVQSPKLKRRLDSSLSISKLIHFPKKIGFWNKNAKRLSWNEVSRKNLLSVDSKIQSKSDNDLTRSDTRIEKSSSRFSIQSLTESPMARRRLKIIRRYVDEDID